MKDLTFLQLSDAFHDHAVTIAETKDTSAKFRSASYERVSGLLGSRTDEKVTTDKIAKLDISEYMKARALAVLEGKPIVEKKKITLKKKKPIKKVRGRSRTARVKSKSPTKSKSPAKSPAKSNTTLLKQLNEFMGLGPEKSKALIEAGLSNINQLHMKKYYNLLPEETKLFINLKPEQKIPHEHIKILEPYILGLSTDDMKITLVGSYRRKKPFSRDIDTMIVSTDENIVEKFSKALSEKLNGKAYPYSKGKDKLSIVIDMTDLLKSKLIYKLDAFRTTPEDAISMLLYSTGSKEFNIMMRAKAKKLGYLLNQKGLFKDGKKIPNLKTEEDYFKILDLEYKDPVDRI
jgi:DNA polymerase/3'-5' exonuclease PolX